MVNEKRLIDVNALKENAKPHYFDNCCYAVSVEDIDNAPTVDAVVLPCEIGHTVFYVDTVCDENGEENLGISVGKIHSFSIQSEGLWAYCRYEDGLTFWHKVLDDFGRVVFLTREEAETAIAKMDGDGNG